MTDEPEDREDKLTELMAADRLAMMEHVRAQEAAIEPPSDMQQAILDSGAKPVEGNPWAYQTNEGTVFLATPHDMKRSNLMDDIAARRFSRFRALETAEIDRLMKEDKD
jgi:hypothetical protein